MAQVIKNLPAMQESQVWPLGQEDTLQKGMPTHSTILAQRIPWREEPGGLQSMGLQRVRHDWVTKTQTHTGQYLKISDGKPQYNWNIDYEFPSTWTVIIKLVKVLHCPLHQDLTLECQFFWSIKWRAWIDSSLWYSPSLVFCDSECLIQRELETVERPRRNRKILEHDPDFQG